MYIWGYYQKSESIRLCNDVCEISLAFCVNSPRFENVYCCYWSYSIMASASIDGIMLSTHLIFLLAPSYCCYCASARAVSMNFTLLWCCCRAFVHACAIVVVKNVFIVALMLYIFFQNSSSVSLLSAQFSACLFTHTVLHYLCSLIHNYDWAGLIHCTSYPFYTYFYAITPYRFIIPTSSTPISSYRLTP